ncbi:MAG: hypothetical protein ACREQJ_02260 [Candidatus Binatia bacterium]
MKRLSAKGERGAGLIEVIVAVLIFAIAVLGFATSTTSARQAGDASRFEAEATTLAMDKLEELRTRLPTDPELGAGAHTDTDNPLRPDAETGGIYTRTWQMTPNLPMLGLGTIEMRVTWPSQLGPRGVVLVSTFTIL